MSPLVMLIVVIYIIPKRGGHCYVYLQTSENKGFRVKKEVVFDTTKNKQEGCIWQRL